MTTELERERAYARALTRDAHLTRAESRTARRAGRRNVHDGEGIPVTVTVGPGYSGLDGLGGLGGPGAGAAALPVQIARAAAAQRRGLRG